MALGSKAIGQSIIFESEKISIAWKFCDSLNMTLDFQNLTESNIYLIKPKGFYFNLSLCINDSVICSSASIDIGCFEFSNVPEDSLSLITIPANRTFHARISDWNLSSWHSLPPKFHFAYLHIDVGYLCSDHKIKKEKISKRDYSFDYDVASFQIEFDAKNVGHDIGSYQAIVVHRFLDEHQVTWEVR